MNLKIIDGVKLAKLREGKLGELLFLTKVTPRVVSILIGADPPSVLYTLMKQKKAEEIGIDFKALKYSIKTEFKEVYEKISELNNDIDIH